MIVYLVSMRDSIARSCRVAWSLGADRVVLVDTPEPPRKHLFSARTLHIETAQSWPDTTLLLEVNSRCLLREVDWAPIDAVAVGGASFSFSRADLARCPSAIIPYRRPCLIGDQALAIALYARAESTRPRIGDARRHAP